MCFTKGLVFCSLDSRDSSCSESVERRGLNIYLIFLKLFSRISPIDFFLPKEFIEVEALFPGNCSKLFFCFLRYLKSMREDLIDNTDSPINIKTLSSWLNTARIIKIIASRENKKSESAAKNNFLQHFPS